MSVEERQPERFEKRVTESIDFNDRLHESQYLKEVESYKALSTNYNKQKKNEQNKKASGS